MPGTAISIGVYCQKIVTDTSVISPMLAKIAWKAVSLFYAVPPPVIWLPPRTSSFGRALQADCGLSTVKRQSSAVPLRNISLLHL